MNRLITKLPFTLLAALTVLLAAITFVERRYGTAFVIDHCYGSWWMATFWAALFLSALSFLRFLYRKKKPVFALHGAFGVILLGALCTFVTAQRGQVHLRDDDTTSSTIELPFDIHLSKFEIKYYDSTNTPTDYISHISITDGEQTMHAVVSMNNIFRHRGFRFYQASYDRDLKGSILTVNYDPYGIALTYTGYFLLLCSMIWILADRKGNFRRLLKMLTIAALLVIPGQASAQRTLTKEEAATFGRLPVSYNGRIVPVDTYARDFTLKITGKTSYKGFNAVQVLVGWVLYPYDWRDEPMIKIRDKMIRRRMSNDGKDADRLRLSDFYSSGVYKLSYMDFPVGYKGIAEADEKINLLLSQQSVFPSMQLTQGTLSSTRTTLEIWYNHCNIIGFLYKFNLALGLLSFILFLRGALLSPSRRTDTANTRKFALFKSWLFRISLFVSFALQTATLGARWYISGHIPLSNGYETMLCVAWFALLATILLYKRVEVVLAAGLLLSGFALLVASLGAINPQITPLVPVLMSPWLSIHVSLMMISYSLLGLIMFNGLTALTLHFTVPNSHAHATKLQIISRLMLYPALFALVAGIFTGAVWANVSWGRYWGWDPKEVWALVTMFVYSFAMHERSLPFFRKPLFFHVFTVIAFLTVVMTYLGVNLLFGGMHSYS